MKVHAMLTIVPETRSVKTFCGRWGKATMVSTDKPFEITAPSGTTLTVTQSTENVVKPLSEQRQRIVAYAIPNDAVTCYNCVRVFRKAIRA